MLHSLRNIRKLQECTFWQDSPHVPDHNSKTTYQSSFPNGSSTPCRGPPPSGDLVPVPHGARRAQPPPLESICHPGTTSPGGHSSGASPAPPSGGRRNLGLRLGKRGSRGHRVPRRPARYAALPTGNRKHLTFGPSLCFRRYSSAPGSLPFSAI
jgi:hypothetical protein